MLLGVMTALCLSEVVIGLLFSFLLFSVIFFLSAQSLTGRNAFKLNFIVNILDHTHVVLYVALSFAAEMLVRDILMVRTCAKFSLFYRTLLFPQANLA